MQRYLLLPTFALIVFLAACGGSGSVASSGGGDTGGGGATQGQPTLQSIAVSPSSATIAPATTQTFTAMGTYSDGSTKDLTLMVQWACLAPTVATVGGSSPTQGIATGVAPGSALISATMGGVTSNATLTVTDATLSTSLSAGQSPITITPATASVGIGGQQQFTAMALFSDGTSQDITNSSCWSLTAQSGTSVPFIAAGSGLAMGQIENIGTNTVTANFPKSTTCSPFGNYQGSGTAALSVGLLSPTSNLVSMSILPSTLTIAAHTQQRFSAIGLFSDGSTRDITSTVTSWSSSDASVGSFAGTESLLTARAVGSTNLTATTCTSTDPVTFACNASITSAPATLSVTDPTLSSILVYPLSPPSSGTIAPGTKQSYAATGVFSDNSTQDLSGVLWILSSYNDANIPTGIGTVTAYLPPPDMGTQTAMVYVFGPSALGFLQSNNSTLNIDENDVIQSVAITPGSAILTPGATVSYTATGTFVDSSTQATSTQDITDSVTWGSKNPSVATVSSNVITGEGVGNTTITAKFGTGTGTFVTGSSTLTVVPTQQLSIAVSPATIQVAPGTDAQLKAIATLVDGTTQDFTSSVQWSSSAPGSATVSGESGLVSALVAGTTTITATLGALSSTAQVSVTGATLQSIAVSPSTATVTVGATQQFSAMGTFSDDSTQDVTSSVTWSASAAQPTSSICSVNSQTGLATGIIAGTSPATITATLGATSGSAQVGVTNAP